MAAPRATAWAIVMAGFDEALGIDGLPDSTRGRLLRCRRLCAQLANAPLMQVVES